MHNYKRQHPQEIDQERQVFELPENNGDKMRDRHVFYQNLFLQGKESYDR